MADLVAQDLTDLLPRPGDMIALGAVLALAAVFECPKALRVFDEPWRHLLDRDLQVDGTEAIALSGMSGLRGAP